jgi:cell wall assembly regulator SMI1
MGKDFGEEQTMAKRKSEPVTGQSPILADLLARIDRWLSKHRKRYYKALLPGASPAECEALAKALGRPLPDELHTWLTWHDGQSEEEPGAFVESWRLMSSAEIALTWQGDDSPELARDKSNVPFLHDEQGDYVCLTLAETAVPVREVWRGQEDSSVVAASLTAWVTDFVTALEAGAYKEDRERGGFHRAS